MVAARTVSLLASVFCAAMTVGYGALPLPATRLLAARLRGAPSAVASSPKGDAPTAAAGRVAESTALAALRSPEFEAFGHARQPVRPELPGPVSVCGTGPERRVCQADIDPSSGTADASWLVGLRAPDLAIHASLRVERFFKYLTESTAGRKVFRGWLKHRGRYHDVVAQALRDRGLPQDLEALVFVESGYSPRAVSSEGAVGLWQFVPGTARIYGLAVDADYDERRSVERSTEAATRYLSDLHERFGSWELAMAAYDMGYGRLTHRVQDLSTNDYWTLSLVPGALPSEALAYVPKILAVALLLRNLDHFGFDAVEGDPAVTTGELDVPGGTPLSLVARAAGTSLEQLRMLNPEILGASVPDRGAPLPVHVPPRGLVRANIMLPQLLARWQPDEQEERVDDRFDWGFDELAPRRRPGGRASTPLLEAPLAANAPYDSDPAEAADGAPVRSAASVDDDGLDTSEEGDRADASVEVFYRVDDGETLPAIARRFGTRVARIVADNHLDPGAKLLKGMLLMIRTQRGALSKLASVRPMDERSYPAQMRVDDGGAREPAATAQLPAELTRALRPVRNRVKRNHGGPSLGSKRTSEMPDLFARSKP